MISIEYKINKEIIMRRINKLREKDDIMDYLQKINTKLDILLKNYNLNF
jgi:hypothetical protein